MTKHWTSPVALQQAWPSLLLIIGQKATFLLIASSTPVGFNLMRWDSLWFRSVALLGYSAAGRDIPGAEKLSGLAFFPVYPLSARVLSNLTGIDIAVALIGLSWAGTLAAAWGIFAVGQHVAGRSAAVFLVGLWGAAPRSLVEVLAYSEGPFTALVAWCLYALLTTRFRTAAALGFIAGLTRGAALPMLGAILLDALLQGLSAAKGKDQFLRRLLSSARGPITVAASTGIGFITFWLFVAWRTGRWDGYAAVQRAWGTTMEWPWLTVVDYLREGAAADFIYGTFIAGVLLVYAGLIAAMVAAKERGVLTWYAALMLLWTLCSRGYFHAKARFMVPAFTAWLPVARLLARLPWWASVAALAVFTSLGIWFDVATYTSRYSP